MEYRELTKKRLMDTMVIDRDGCWIWNGYLLSPRKNYGLTSSNLDGKRKKILAHRLSYRLWNGEIPNGMYVLHHCDKPLCINPKCLHLGTQKDNMDEMRDRGRKVPPRGMKSCTAKLTDEDIIEIRRLFSEGYSNAQLARKFGVYTSTMSYIIRRKTWKHI